MKLPELTIGKKKRKQEKAKAAAEAVGQESPAEKLGKGMVDVKDIIAPSAIEVDFNHVKIGDTFYRTLFVW